MKKKSTSCGAHVRRATGGWKRLGRRKKKYKGPPLFLQVGCQRARAEWGGAEVPSLRNDGHQTEEEEEEEVPFLSTSFAPGGDFIFSKTPTQKNWAEKTKQTTRRLDREPSTGVSSSGSPSTLSERRRRKIRCH